VKGKDPHLSPPFRSISGWEDPKKICHVGGEGEISKNLRMIGETIDIHLLTEFRYEVLGCKGKKQV